MCIFSSECDTKHYLVIYDKNNGSYKTNFILFDFKDIFQRLFPLLFEKISNGDVDNDEKIASALYKLTATNIPKTLLDAHIKNYIPAMISLCISFDLEELFNAIIQTYGAYLENASLSDKNLFNRKSCYVQKYINILSANNIKGKSLIRICEKTGIASLSK